MSELRKYDGPHDAVELMVADGEYHTIEKGQTVTVSDELAAKLPDETWKKGRGKPGEETIDDPQRNPATMPPPRFEPESNPEAMPAPEGIELIDTSGQKDNIVDEDEGGDR